MTLARTLPNSEEAERMVLACCMLDGAEVVARCVLAGITPLSFYAEAHVIVFEHILGLYGAQKSTDVHVVAEALKTAKQLDQIGGYAMMSQISDAAPTQVQLGYFIEKVKEAATLRAVIRTCTAAVEECYNFTGGIEELTGGINARVSAATGSGSDQSEESFQATAKALLVEVTTPAVERKQTVGEVPWGLIDIDRSCGRMQPGNLVVVAGMPSTGKSALADQVAWANAAVGVETLIFTYEMSKRDKAVRIAQQVSRLNYDQLQGAPIDRKRSFVDSVRMISDCKNLHVFERDISVNRLVSRVRAFTNRGKKIGFIVVDFLQYLARLEPQIGRERTDEKIGRMTAALKQTARECECPVMLISSLNRDGYRDGARPTLASLRSSGEIESDADVVAILHWPKSDPNSGVEQDPHDSMQSRFFVEFNQEKGRSKGVHAVGLSFDRQATRFENYIR